MPFEQPHSPEAQKAALDFNEILELAEALPAIEHEHTEYSYEEGGVIKVSGQGIWSKYILDLITGTIQGEEHSSDVAPSALETGETIKKIRTENIEAALASITAEVLEDAA